MAGTDILKEFLIAIGWKVDEVGQKKTFENVAKLEKNLLALGAAATAAAVAVTAGLERMGKAFEQAYYQSSRTSSSVRDLEAFKYAAAQMGSSAEEATSAVEGLAKRIRENPGYGNWLKTLGASDPKNIVKSLNEIAPKLASMPLHVAESISKQFDIPENLLLALRQIGEFRKFQAEGAKKYNILGFDPQEAAKDGQSLTRMFRDLYDTIGKIVDKTASGVFRNLQPSIEQLNTFLLANGKQISETLVQIANAVLQIATELAKFLASDEMGRFFKSLGDPEQWKDVKDSFGWLVGQLKEIRTLFRDIAKFSNWLDSKTGLHLPGANGGMSGGGAPAGDPMALANGPYAKPNTVGGKIVDAYRNTMPRLLGGRDRTKHSRPGMLRGEQKANADAWADELKKAGYNENAVAATLGSVETESSFNPKAHNGIAGGHTGHWQWDSTRWPKIKAWIEAKGGNPFDTRWQARAWVAEHDAKPGDALYDTKRTERGGQILRNNPSLPDAIHGVRESERFGAGEEGGRAANAERWLPKVKAPPAAAKLPPMPKMAPSPFGDLSGVKSSLQPGNPLGATNDNSRKNITIHDNSRTTVSGVSDPTAAAGQVGARKDKQHSMLLKNVQSAIG